MSIIASSGLIEIAASDDDAIGASEAEVVKYLAAFESGVKCDGCGERPGYIEVDDSDPSVGYHSRLLLCGECDDSRRRLYA